MYCAHIIPTEIIFRSVKAGVQDSDSWQEYYVETLLCNTVTHKLFFESFAE